jgi:hypothetical protein
MEIAEHFYVDDPAVGHPDVRTRLTDTDYFFLGNGHIQAAIQVCRSGEGTPLGLLIMNPERFGPKRAALTCDPTSGLRGTTVEVEAGRVRYEPHPRDVRADWEVGAEIPTVRATWQAGEIRVEERFSCPDSDLPRIVREVRVRADHPVPGPLVLYLGPTPSCELPQDLAPAREAVAILIHEIHAAGREAKAEARWETDESRGGGPASAVPAFLSDLEPRWAVLPHRPGPGTDPEDGASAQYWRSLTRFRTSHHGLNHVFLAARNQLPTAVDHRGRMDGSIWQYNLEWVRDQSHVAEALVRLGDQGKARTMLTRLLDEMVSPEGDTVDSGRRRLAAEVELDQNGELLSALATYVGWTGDLGLAEARWDRVRALAAFPLQERFRHSQSGLLHNRRDYWERHGGHGIQDGFELLSQFAVALGLEAAAGVAELLGREEDRAAWARAAAGLKHAMLEDPLFRLVEEGHLIKRRGVDGAWQRTIHLDPDLGLPRGIPLLEEGSHFLDPDTSSVLPVAQGFIPPRGELARNTLAGVEELWNQRWEGGGYGRYHTSSEPDSPGAWPFASLFVARAYTEAGEDAQVWRILDWLLQTGGGRAGSWFENDGPRIAPPYPQVGITPWTWAEVITLCVHHILGVRPDHQGITLRPHLLEGLTEMEATLRVRSHQLHLVVRRAPSPETRGGVVDGTRFPWEENGVRLPLPRSDAHVEVLC